MVVPSTVLPDLPVAALAIALLALWFLDRARIIRERDCEAEAKREHRLALAYLASRHDFELSTRSGGNRSGESISSEEGLSATPRESAALFAGAFLGGHHQVIGRNYPDFPDFRAREIERQLEESETNG